MNNKRTRIIRVSEEFAAQVDELARTSGLSRVEITRLLLEQRGLEEMIQKAMQENIRKEKRKVLEWSPI